MASLIVAISAKAINHLEGTELGKLIEAGTVLANGSREITIDATTETKLLAAKTEDGGKRSDLADRLIVKVSEARTRGEAEAALRGEI